jgi:hypothetical protein
MQAVAVEAVLLLLALVGQAVAVLVLLLLITQLREQPTRGAVAVAQEMPLVVVEMALLAVLVLSFCLSQQTNIREQPRVLQRLQQAGQIQF